MLKNFFVILIIVFSAYSAQGESSVALKPVLQGLDRPWAAAPLAKDEFLITLKGGRLVHYKKGRIRTFKANLPLVQIGQGGLLDILPAPDFNVSREIFVTFSKRKGKGAVTALGKFVFTGNPPRPRAWKTVFTGNNYGTHGIHFGSRLAFDREGYLYMTFGDRRDRPKVQNLRFHNGKTIRITRRGKAVKDNPLADRRGALAEIFTYGHRNSQGMALHPVTGKIWQHEHGPRGGDEVNIIREGTNYGWPVITHGREYSGRKVGKGITAKQGMAQPLLHWTPSIAPSGMAFYTGSDFPRWKHALFAGALAGQHVRVVTFSGNKVIKQEKLFQGKYRIRDIRMGKDGYLYILTDGKKGILFRLVRKGKIIP